MHAMSTSCTSSRQPACILVQDVPASTIGYALPVACPDAPTIPDAQVEEWKMLFSSSTTPIPPAYHAILSTFPVPLICMLHPEGGDACWADYMQSELFEVFESLSEATAAWIPKPSLKSSPDLYYQIQSHADCRYLLPVASYSIPSASASDAF